MRGIEGVGTRRVFPVRQPSSYHRGPPGRIAVWAIRYIDETDFDHIHEIEIGQPNSLRETEVGPIVETEVGSVNETEIEHGQFLFHGSYTETTISVS